MIATLHVFVGGLGLIAWLWITIAAFERLLPRALAPADRLAFAWSLGPLTATSIVALLRIASVPHWIAGSIAIVVALVLLLAGRRRARGAGEPGPRIDRRVGAIGIALGALPVALFFALHHLEARVWDSPFQTQIASALLFHPIPTENPFLAGEALPYPWWFGLEAAMLRAMTGLSLWRVFALLMIHGTVGLFLALALLVPARIRTRGGARRAMLLAFWAPNALTWLLLVARWFTGGATGRTAIHAELEAWSRVLDQMALGYSQRLAFPAHKWFQAEPFAVGLSFFFLSLRAVTELRRGGGRVWSLLLSASLVCWILVHYMSAMLCAPILGLVALLVPPRSMGTHRPVRQIVVAYLAALAITAPYLSITLGASLAAGGAREAAIGLSLESIVGLLVIAVPYLLVSRLAPRAEAQTAETMADDGERLLLWTAIAFGLFGIVLKLSDQNVTKVLFPAAFLVPLLASPALERALSASRWRRVAARAFVVAAFAGALLVLTFAFGWKSDPMLYRLDPRLDAILAGLPDNALLIGDEVLPTESRHSSYLLQPSLIGQWGFRSELSRREGTITALKGAALRRAENVPATREEWWPAPRPRTREEAWSDLTALGRPLVFIVPRGGWLGLPRESLEELGRLDQWEVLLAPTPFKPRAIPAPR